MEPLCKRHVGDKSFVPYTVEPLCKRHVGDKSFVPYIYSGASLQETNRDGFFVSYAKESLYKGLSWGRSFVLYTVEPLCKGMHGPFIPYLPTRDKLVVLFSEVANTGLANRSSSVCI